MTEEKRLTALLSRIGFPQMRRVVADSYATTFPVLASKPADEPEGKVLHVRPQERVQQRAQQAGRGAVYQDRPLGVRHVQVVHQQDLRGVVGPAHRQPAEQAGHQPHGGDASFLVLSGSSPAGTSSQVVMSLGCDWLRTGPTSDAQVSPQLQASAPSSERHIQEAVYCRLKSTAISPGPT
ncbi:hypothetical protein EYF80_039122 [Liparis tanakae]|uniref:Uncharacterized protein n=1 Tax=Liparis tanakae TaxID=230148 RepID=A0A4Z2GDC8_9TELE|nr:hypothetical protein EYF80_039122 [Liparis tanakae]